MTPFRIALIFLLTILAADASAYPAVSASTYSVGSLNAAPKQASFSAAVSAYCSDKADCGTSGRATSGSGAPACADGLSAAGIGSPSNYICYRDMPGGSGQWHGYSRIFTNALENSCPNGGTLSGSNCNCAGGETDTGSACVANDCPTLGASMGYHALTAGWTLSPTVGANDYVGGWAVGIYGSTHCVKNDTDLCAATVDPQVGSRACWRSQAPADGTGLYRVTCDMAMVSGGSTCTPTGDNPSNPTAAAPACPTGNVGEVNGRSVCLGTVPTSGVNLGAPEGQGNPRAGTGSEESNESREPTAGSGGAPDARGGPGVTTGPGGTGTGANQTPTGGGPGSNAEIDFPDDYNREVTQQAILNKLGTGVKIDETGTGTGAGTDTESKATVTTEMGKLSTKLDEVVAGSVAPDRSWGVSFSFPTNCSAMNFGTARWGFFSADFCDWQPIVHDIMSLVWIASTLFLCMGMVFRAISAG